MKSLSFFSGALGLDIGLEQAGIKSVLACEIDKNARETIKTNRPDLNVIEDINEFNISDFESKIDFSKIDLIEGGPPCQAFSTAGKRKGFNDSRGNVFLKFLNTIELIKPKYFVIENVRGLLSTKFELDFSEFTRYDLDERLYAKKGSALLYAVRRMEECGYEVNFNLYNSMFFGVPQSRERVIIIGTLDKNRVPFLKKTHGDGLEKIVTTKEVFKGIDYSNDRHQKLSERTLKYIKHLKSGENWRNLPENLIEEAMGNSYKLGGGKTGFYRRLDWDKVSPTIVTSPVMPATLLCHPKENRPLSIKECARIQQFPDNWNFQGNVTSIYKQIGNAVPVGLGRAIGEVIVNHHNGISLEEENQKYSRYKNTSYDEFMVDMHKFINQIELF